MPGVFQAMLDAQGNVGGLVFGHQKHFVALGHPGSAGHHNPVLGPMVMHLQDSDAPGFTQIRLT
jgi:hypothetical protein